MTFSSHTVSLQSKPAFSSYVPYIDWNTASGLRQAYLGWRSDVFNLTLENGFNFSINGGNVGIGTDAPSANLEVVGWGQFIRNPQSSEYTTLRLLNDMNNAARALEIDYSGSAYTQGLLFGGPTGESACITTTQAYPLALGTNNTARLTILGDGSIGVGTGAPTARFTIQQNSGGWNDGIRLNLMNKSWDIVADEDGDRLVIAKDHNMHNSLVLKDGMCGIGSPSPDAKLTVNGNVHSKEVRVDLNVPAPDYVFEEDYNLPSLLETESFIKQNKHLPEIPAGKEMEQNGVNLGEMNMLLLKKVEELTLYMIELKKENEQIKSRLKEIESK